MRGCRHAAERGRAHLLRPCPAITARVRPETAHGILRVIAFVLLLCNRRTDNVDGVQSTAGR
jgi:hypothetical protein